MELKGRRIRLREFGEGDVAALAAVHSDPRVLAHYAPEVGTLEHARMLIESFIQWANETPRRNFQLAIVDAETGSLMGSCGVRSRSCPPGSAEFGIGIGSSWWGRGIAREAAKLILDFGFAELGLDEIHGVTVAENESVAKLMRRLGFAARAARSDETWMKERGWHALEWVITRETWDRSVG